MATVLSATQIETPEFFPIIGEKAPNIFVRHFIDCDAKPFIPEEWEIKSHKKLGMLEWDLAKVSLYLSGKQKQKGMCDYGEIIERELELRGEPVCNANVLDYLLFHQELISGGLIGMTVYFWATQYFLPTGKVCIRCMASDGKLWHPHWSLIKRAFTSYTPALCLS